MTKGGAKKMKIKVKTDTGELDRVTDENNNEATEMTADEVEQLYQNPAGVMHVGTILHAHSSPGCVYYFYRGRYYKVCR